MSELNVQHSSRTDGWYTPAKILELARTVLNTINLDPASSEEANEQVKASFFYTEHEDGLSVRWIRDCTVFLNPPGGKVGNKSKAGLFWKKLMEYRDAGHLTDAIFLAFSVEALQSTQGKGCKPIAEFPFCVPAKRIAFMPADGSKKSAPSHSNMIVYVPGSLDRTELFVETFKTLGAVVNTKKHP